MPRPHAPASKPDRPHLETHRRTRWISLTRAALLMDLHRASARRVCEAGGVRRREYPGHAALYCREDVERVVAESEKAGRAAEGGAA